MMALSDPMAANNSDRIVSLSFQYRIPVVSPYMHMAKAGAVLAYGAPSCTDVAASLVARVLKGANPGDLPIEQPSQFDMVINVKSARSFGLRNGGREQSGSRATFFVLRTRPDCCAAFALFLYLHPIRYSAQIRWYRSITCSS